LPAIITHSFFADDVFEELKDCRLKDEIQVKKSLFRLGAQGPDVFFYYKAAPWIPYDGIEKLGNLIHDEKVGHFYSRSFDYLNGMEHDKGFFDLAVYLAGYLCHYSLDRTAHPFIHYTSGIDSDHSRISWKYHIYHRILESTIDYLMLVKKGYDPSKYRSFELVMVPPFSIESVLKYYKHILAEVYGISINRQQTEELITGIYKVMRYLYDPSGMKYYFYRFLEMLMRRPGGITSSMMPRKIDRELDYLNLDHNTWLHPCHKDRSSNDSFWEIYDSAAGEALKTVELFSSFIDSGRLPPSLIKMIGDISYSTGISCNSTSRLTYFDSIFED
jgi:hypothetical protein